MLAASSEDKGGERRVFEKPFRGVLIITPIAHLSVTAGFRQGEVSISSFIACVHGARVCLQRAAGYFFVSDRESSLFPDPSFLRRNYDTGAAPFVCAVNRRLKHFDAPFVRPGSLKRICDSSLCSDHLARLIVSSPHLLQM